MRVLAGLAAVPVLLLAWIWHSDRSLERRLAPIASEIAGRPVEVDCQGLLGSLLDVKSRDGEVLYNASGIPEARLFLTRRTCSRLRAFAGSERHEELDCLGGLDWGAQPPLPLGSPCYETSSGTVYALLTFAHEAYHTAGVLAEAPANCFAIQSMGWAAARLGAPAEEAELAARAMAALEPFQGGEYGMDDCVRGSRFDLWPETWSFPTEWPLRPPFGRGGMRGVASGASEARAATSIR